jgi:hypothetical protein
MLKGVVAVANALKAVPLVLVTAMVYEFAPARVRVASPEIVSLSATLVAEYPASCGGAPDGKPLPPLVATQVGTKVALIDASTCPPVQTMLVGRVSAVVKTGLSIEA